MKYEYNARVVDLEKVTLECNSMGQENWELVTALPYSRVNCCNQTVPTVVLIFKKSA
jgi:hypothetical protein